MEKTFYDFSGKNIAAVKKEVRSALLADFMEFLSQKYEKVVPVSNTELAVLMGVWTDADGYSHDVVGKAKASCTAFYDSVGEKGRETVQYDIDSAADSYLFEQEQKAIKKQKNAEKYGKKTS